MLRKGWVSLTVALLIFGGYAYSQSGSSTAPGAAPAGTQSAPGFWFFGDRDTGLFRASADVLAVTTGGTEDARFHDSTLQIGSGAGGTDAVFSESGIDRSSGSAETFNIQNSGAGAITLQVDGVAVRTAGHLIGRQIFTGSGTWTKPAGLGSVIVRQWAGGGGGGGSDQDATGAGVGGGGGAGGYCEKRILNASLGATETVTIGAAGTGGAAGANSGTAGGNSAFGTHCTTNGGAGGSSIGAGATAAHATGGAGGTATGGDLNVTGGTAGYAIRHSAVNVQNGAGGGSYGSAITPPIANTNTSFNGTEGRGPGAGGSGASSVNGTTDRAGGNGAAGLIIVEEYS